METDRLLYFQVITETGSLTKAAQLLGLSHSGLSKAMSTLENELGLSLFRAQGRGLEVTEEGLEVYRRSKSLLEGIGELKLLKTNREKQTLAVGMSEVLALTCLEFLTNEFSGNLTILQADLGEIESKVLSKELDVGFVFSPSPHKALDHLKIGEIEFNAYACESLLKKYEDERELPFCIPANYFPENPLGHKTRDGWPWSIERLVQYRVSHFSLALNLLSSGKASCYIPDFVAREMNKDRKKDKLVKIKNFKAAASRRQVYLVKLNTVEEDSTSKKLARMLRVNCCL